MAESDISPAIRDFIAEHIDSVLQLEVLLGGGTALAHVRDAYAQRRVSVVSLIFNKPTDALRNFANAFRLRKDKD